MELIWRIEDVSTILEFYNSIRIKTVFCVFLKKTHKTSRCQIAEGENYIKRRFRERNGCERYSVPNAHLKTFSVLVTTGRRC